MSLADLIHSFEATAEGVDDPKLVAELESALRSGVDNAMPALIEEQARIYAALFTTEQLNDIYVYFSNPARAKLGAADAARMELWRNYVQALSGDITARSGREFCKSQDCHVPERPAAPVEGTRPRT